MPPDAPAMRSRSVSTLTPNLRRGVVERPIGVGVLKQYGDAGIAGENSAVVHLAAPRYGGAVLKPAGEAGDLILELVGVHRRDNGR